MTWRDKARYLFWRPLTAIPAFRAFWIGSTISLLGGQLSAFALLYDVWTVSRSAAQTKIIEATTFFVTGLKRR